MKASKAIEILAMIINRIGDVDILVDAQEFKITYRTIRSIVWSTMERKIYILLENEENDKKNNSLPRE